MIAKKLGLSLATTAAALIGVEVCLRALGLAPNPFEVNKHFGTDSVYGWAEPHPVLGWKNRPGAYRSSETGEVLMNFWQHGRRASRSRERAVAPHLAIFLGGSLIQGYGIRDEETLVYRLGQEFPKVTFENFGTGGYGTVQALLSLDEAARAEPVFEHPEFVFCNFISHHLVRNVADPLWIQGLTTSDGRNVVPPWGRIAGGSLVIEPFRVIDAWSLEGRSATISGLHKSWLRVQGRSRTADAHRVTILALSQLAVRAREKGARLIVLLLDTPPELSSRALATQAKPAVDAVARELVAAGIDHIDCRIHEDRSEPIYRTGGTEGHPSAHVNRLWTECAASWLRDNGGDAFQVPAPAGAGL